MSVSGFRVNIAHCRLANVEDQTQTIHFTCQTFCPAMRTHQISDVSSSSRTRNHLATLTEEGQAWADLKLKGT
eukprot:scaffold6733_cov77-Cyclotella_meneghiniana.AAC.2